MSSRPAAVGLAVAWLAMSAAAMAQQAPTAPQPPAWRSAMQGYQPFSDEKTAPWQASNEAARAAGGWRAYAQESQAPQAAETPAGKPAPAATGGTAPHSQHKH